MQNILQKDEQNKEILQIRFSCSYGINLKTFNWIYMAYSSRCCLSLLAFVVNFKENFSRCLMDIRHQRMSASCMCSSSSLENTEYEFIKSSTHRSFMDAADAVAVFRPQLSWPFLTADLAGRCISSGNTKPKSPGISTNTPKEVRKSELVIWTDDVDTTVPVNDASVQDFPGKTSSTEDAVPVSNVLVKNSPAKDNTLQDTCLETDIVAVNNTSLNSIMGTVSRDSHPLESDSAVEVEETNSRKVSCATTEVTIQSSSFSYSSRLMLYKDAKISNCCDTVKPRSSSYDAIPDCEIMNQYCKKFTKQRRKDRPQRSKRKWKRVPDEMQLNLRTSLFPRTGILINSGSVDDIEENEIQQELELFQNDLQSCEQTTDVGTEINETCTAAVSNPQELFADSEGKETVETQQMCEQLDTDINANCVDIKSSIPVNVCVEKNSPGHDTNKILPELNSKLGRCKHKLDPDVCWFSDCESIENLTFYENKIPLRYGSDLECFSRLTNQKLRAKKKWKEAKAHVQIKTKYCRSLSNSVHGQTFYIHHRVIKLMQMELGPKPRVFPLSLKGIDATKGLENIKGIVGTVPGGHAVKSQPNRSAPTTSRFAMDAYNADGDLAAEVVNIMINLQHRDLLPEDYDLLLRLDDRVKPKTVDGAILTRLKTESVVCDGDVLDVCAVCLDPYEVGQTKKYLPCQHYFHEACIDNWLSNSSMNCPLDGTAVS